MSYTGSIYGDGKSTATTGANTNTHFYDRAGIKAATEMNIYAKWADRKSMPLKYGRTFKISKFLHILDDNNVNNQGLDKDGNVSTGKAGYIASGDYGSYFFEVEADADAFIAEHGGTKSSITAIENNGNQYGSNRDVTDVTAGMPTLSEGADRVNRVGVTKVTLQTEFARYGNFIEYSDEVDLFSEDSIQIKYREELGYMAGQVSDDLVQLGMLNSAGVHLYGGSATSIATVGNDAAASGTAGVDDDSGRLTFKLARKISKRLFTNKATKNTSIITGSTSIDTTPVAAAYYALIGSDVRYDLDDIPQFTPVEKYASTSTIVENEVGKLHDTRFIESERALKHSGGGAAVTNNANGLANNGSNYDVFPILYPTKGAYATVGLNGHGKIKFKSKAPGKAEINDPYGNKGLFSYNFWFAGMALQPEKLLVAWVAASE
jgi:N4-gp56 family major capsid protein